MRLHTLQTLRQHASRRLALTSSLVCIWYAVVFAGCATTASTTGAAQAAPTITPPPITNEAPTHQLLSGAGISAIKPHLSGIPNYSADDMKHFVLTTPIVGPDHTSNPPTIVVADFLGCADIKRYSGGGLAHILSGCGQTRYGLVVEEGAFAFAGPGSGPHITASRIFLLFDPTSGNLLLYGSALNQSATSTPTPQPGQPTPTATVAPHVTLILKPTNEEQSCQFSSTVLTPTKLTLDNTGSNVAVTWTATVSDKIGTSGVIWAGIAPSSGSIPAGQSIQITVTPASNICSLSQSVAPDATYHVVVHYGAGLQLTFADLVHSPIPG